MMTARPIIRKAIVIMTVKDRPAIKLRHELKHSINSGEDYILSARLRKLFPHDRHAGPNGSYRISSLYFDTPYDKALRQKIDGVNCREKFRLRYYNDDLSFIRLEKKYKQGGLCGKRSTRVSLPLVQQLLSGNIDCLLRTGDPLLLELYSKMLGQQLMPKTVVTYDREAFSYTPGNVRITLDRNLRSGRDQLDFLNPQLHHIPVSDGITVLEVKYDEFLPELVKMAVQVPNRQAAAYSKYAVCRRYD